MNTPFLTSLLLVSSVAAPIVAAVLLWGARARGTLSALTPIAALPALLLVLVGTNDVTLTLPWLVQRTVLGLDPIGRVFLGFTSALWLVSGWHARAVLARDVEELRFHLFFLVAMSGNFGLILAQDVSTFFVCFALMGFASVGLVLHNGDPAASRAARIFVGATVIGEALIITGLAYLVVSTGSTRIADLRAATPSLPALICLLAGFGVKAGVLGLHVWLPLAHPAAPVPASAVLSGAMIKAGLLGWIRFLPLGVASLPTAGLVVVGGGVAAAVLGSMVGMLQRNPKAVLAYSSISQMGIITVGLGIALVRADVWLTILPAVLIYATHHSLAKGALFLSIPMAGAAAGTLSLRAVQSGMLVPALALAGAPFTSGAVAKLAIKANVEFLPGAWPAWLGVLLPIAAAGTALAMARFLWLVWPVRGAAADDSAGLWLPWSLMIASVGVGVWLLPGSWELLPAKLSPDKLWLATWPLLTGAALASLSVFARRRLPRWRALEVPAGDLLVLAQRLVARLPGRRSRPPALGNADLLAARLRRVLHAATRELGGTLLAVEASLRSWPAAGSALIAAMAALYLLMRV